MGDVEALFFRWTPGVYDSRSNLVLRYRTDSSGTLPHLVFPLGLSSRNPETLAAKLSQDHSLGVWIGDGGVPAGVYRGVLLRSESDHGRQLQGVGKYTAIRQDRTTGVQESGQHACKGENELERSRDL